MKALYTKMKHEKLKDFILAFDIKTGDDGKFIYEEEKHERICGVTQDLFTSAWKHANARIKYSLQMGGR